ncbi:MAG: FAD-dependent oxidoreductase, partial [Polyangiaceae bacterium]
MGDDVSVASERFSLAITDAPYEATYDVAIIGGGVNGTGVARDLSLRGLKVVLFERNDLAFG